MRCAADIILFLCLAAGGGVVWSKETKDQSSAASWTSFSVQASSDPWDLGKPWKVDQHHNKGSWSPSWNSHQSQEWQPKHVNYPSPDIEIHVRAKPATGYARSISYNKPVSYSKKPVHIESTYSPHKPYEKPNYISWDASPPIIKEKISPEEAVWYPNDMPLELIRQSYKWGSQEFDKKFSTKTEDYIYPKNYPSYESKPYEPYEPKPVEHYKPEPIRSYKLKPEPPKASLYEPIPTPLYYHQTSPPPKEKAIVPEYTPSADPKLSTIYEPEPDPTPAPTPPQTPPPTPAPTPPPTEAATAAPIYVSTNPPTTLLTNPPPPPPTTNIPTTVYTTTEPHKTTKEYTVTYTPAAHEPYEPEPYPPYHTPYAPNPYPNIPPLYTPLASPRNYYLNGTPEPKKTNYKGHGPNIRNYYLNKETQTGIVENPEPYEPYQPPAYPTYFDPSPYGHPESPPIYEPNYSPYDPSGYPPEPIPQYPPLQEPPVAIRSYYLRTSKPAQPHTAVDTVEVDDQVGDISKRSSVYGYGVINHQRSSQNKWPFL